MLVVTLALRGFGTGCMKLPCFEGLLSQIWRHEDDTRHHTRARRGIKAASPHNIWLSLELEELPG
jgi:hypothetical protein